MEKFLKIQGLKEMASVTCKAMLTATAITVYGTSLF
jgi:hypothetical protein